MAEYTNYKVLSDKLILEVDFGTAKVTHQYTITD